MKLSEREYLFLVSRINGVGFVRLEQLMQKYGSYKNIWESDIREWNVSEKQREALLNTKKQLNTDEEFEKLHKKDTKILTILDAEYPQNLRNIDSPPIVLYYKGELQRLKEKSLAVIGTRRITPYGKQVVQKLIPELVHKSIVIISGFQRGVDAEAHAAAIENGGTTIAVLGTGIDVDYPTGNSFLYKKILQTNGLILTEYPFATQPLARNFPLRNRIVAGIALGALVIEAALKSGSLITAKYALEQGKEVFAVPGQIFGAYAEGPNALIREGALPVSTPEDILMALGIHTPKANLEQKNHTKDSLILNFLSQGEKHSDEVANALKMDITQVLSELALLELEGRVVSTGYGKYLRIK